MAQIDFPVLTAEQHVLADLSPKETCRAMLYEATHIISILPQIYSARELAYATLKVGELLTGKWIFYCVQNGYVEFYEHFLKCLIQVHGELLNAAAENILLYTLLGEDDICDGNSCNWPTTMTQLSITSPDGTTQKSSMGCEPSGTAESQEMSWLQKYLGLTSKKMEDTSHLN